MSNTEEITKFALISTALKLLNVCLKVTKLREYIHNGNYLLKSLQRK